MYLLSDKIFKFCVSFMFYPNFKLSGFAQGDGRGLNSGGAFPQKFQHDAPSDETVLRIRKNF